MKVSNIGSSKGSARSRRSGGVAGDGAAFARHLDGTGSADTAAPVGETGAATAPDGILMAQSVGHAADREAEGRARRHGEGLLDALDRLRLLGGVIPRDELVALARSLRQRRERTEDPGLEEIIAEIELRAEVEIAKLARADAEAKQRGG